MLEISTDVILQDDEVELTAIRAQGAGGQNVNKVSSAIHLRFDISSSSLPDLYKKRLLELKDKRITKQGIVVIKSQRFRTQEKNRSEAIKRLKSLIKSVTVDKKKRVSTKPSKASKKRRMDEKTKHGRNKQLRRKVTDND